jgi:hypothetical protein
MQTMELRSVVGELILRQHRACYLDLHRATARERYEFLLWQATKGRATNPAERQEGRNGITIVNG